MKIDILKVPFNGDGTPPELENPARALREPDLDRNGTAGSQLVDIVVSAVASGIVGF
jgi:hypothetical protein